MRLIEHDGEQILRLDVSRCTMDEYVRRLDVAAETIRSSPEQSVLALNLLYGFSYSRETMSITRDYAQKNSPFVLASAVVGLDHLSKLVHPTSRLIGRIIRHFDDEERAKTWLVSEKRRLHPDK